MNAKLNFWTIEGTWLCWGRKWRNAVKPSSQNFGSNSCQKCVCYFYSLLYIAMRSTYEKTPSQNIYSPMVLLHFFFSLPGIAFLFIEEIWFWKNHQYGICYRMVQFFLLAFVDVRPHFMIRLLTLRLQSLFI